MFPPLNRRAASRVMDPPKKTESPFRSSRVTWPSQSFPETGTEPPVYTRTERTRKADFASIPSKLRAKERTAERGSTQTTARSPAPERTTGRDHTRSNPFS